MCEYAIVFHRFLIFACLPGFLVTAAERGQQVLVHLSTSFEVGDHDFAKFTITPLVSFLVDIPDNIAKFTITPSVSFLMDMPDTCNIAGSWYTGKVHVL